MTLPQLHEPFTLTIHGLGSNGEGVGYYNGYTVFVDGALPDETVSVKLTFKQKRFGRADLISIIMPSKDRVEPVCPLFGKCGGCQLMHLSYEKQLQIKYQRVVDAMVRIGKLDGSLVEKCISSPLSLGYRNKIQLPVRNSEAGLAIGLYQKMSHDLVEVDECFIHSPLGEETYRAVREIIKTSNIEAYDPKTGSGELRHVLIKSSIHTNQVLVILVTNLNPSTKLQKIAEDIMKRCSAVKGVIHNLNTDSDNVILGGSYHTLVGESFIQEVIGGLKFKVSPASFFQVNPAQAEQLYAKALEFAELTGSERVLDAYCGVGTLSLIFSRQAKSVVGIECVSEAIQDAKENAANNEIMNAEFVCAQSEEYIRKVKGCDVVVLNPPRKGCEKAFLDGIIKLLPKKVIYISCDPATLARDLAILCGSGYAVDQIQPFDMFPQTSHVECVVKLRLLAI